MKISRLRENKNIEESIEKTKKETNHTTIKGIRNFFKLEKENKTSKLNKDIRNLFEQEEEEVYYKPVRCDHFWSDNHIESNGDRNKTVSVKKISIKLDHRPKIS